MKFGGSSVGTAAALTQVVGIVLHEYERWDRLIIVASALEGVTDSLLEAAHLAGLSNRRGYRRITATIRTRHLSLVEQLPLGPTERSALNADIDRLLFDMLDVCQAVADLTTDTVPLNKLDAIISVGERLAARIIAALVRQNHLRSVALDATDLIVTDDTFTNANPDMTLTRARIQEHLLPMLDRRIVPVVTGFIGGTVKGEPTTLGRGGSDLSASILGTCSDAREVWIWTDVDGMMSTDPREVENARVIAEMTYDEAAELAYFGARILHARMIAPLRERGISLRVKNVFKPQAAGTRIHAMSRGSETALGRIKAVTAIQGVGLTAAQSGSLAGITALVDETFHKAIGSHADVMISSQSSSHSFLTFVIPTSAGPDALHTTQVSLEARLRQSGAEPLWKVQPVAIITLIGHEIDSSPSLTGTLLAALETRRILGLAHGPSRCSLSLVVDSHIADATLRHLHQLILDLPPRP
jgi:aspartate kinase